ncbi:carboxymuconolactone decarboxylase family protein [Enterovirga rhinocerotis]|uniref:AhpD family alkylhydroperoxidase n=1 Tax=Enterovirga rhinocerotis TaxID=1339210 RepID=A0A4R7BMV9_9HYPH|nr:carboxymuconolactone decarboxylase family protein [Enterovirga rhinocerotis]TDR85257.1 AhpD family alkylhydroperoxidase [Enterovirga rhinocerotis]
MTKHNDWTATPSSKRLSALGPEPFQRFVDFERAAFKAGALDRKTKELIAIAVTLTTQCDSCITHHTHAAKAEGATDEEIAEAVFVAMELRAGAALSHFRSVHAALTEIAAAERREAAE